MTCNVYNTNFILYSNYKSIGDVLRGTNRLSSPVLKLRIRHGYVTVHYKINGFGQQYLFTHIISLSSLSLSLFHVTTFLKSLWVQQSKLCETLYVTKFIKYFTYLFLVHLQNSMVQFLYLFEMKFSLLKNILVSVN